MQVFGDCILDFFNVVKAKMFISPYINANV